MTLEDALGLPIFRSSRLLTNPELAGESEINSVSVIEVPVGQFIRPGEFVMSTGMNVGRDTGTLARFVGEVAKAGAAALALAVGPYTPRIPQPAVTTATRARLALIELPWELRFSEITEAILRRLIEEQVATRARDDFVWALVSQSLNEEAAVAQARRLGYDLSRKFIGVVGKLAGQPSTPARDTAGIAETLCGQVAAQSHLQWLGTVAGERIVGFIEAPRSRQAVALAKAIQARASGKVTISWGVGRVSKDFGDFRKSYDDARIACEIGARVRGEGSITEVADVLADRVLLNMRPDPDVVTLLDRYIQPLQTSKRMPLLTTLEAFFEGDCNASATARQLAISRQSLLYRIARIEEILHVDLHDPGHRFAISLALRLSRFSAGEYVSRPMAGASVPKRSLSGPRRRRSSDSGRTIPTGGA